MELKFTKFFPVNSPLGIQQKEDKNHQYQSIGVDYYMPKPTPKFVEEFVKRNKNSFFNINTAIFSGDADNTYSRFCVAIEGKIVLEFKNKHYYIYDDVQIPTGIGLLIPEDYFVDLRSKSGNFGNGYTSVTGLIDENYTYGSAVQIIPRKNEITLQPNEKFAQIVLIKGHKIQEMIEVNQKEWDAMPEVIDRREIRKGGFGHTGKFDKISK